MPIHISIAGAGDFAKAKTPRVRTMPFSFADPFAASPLKMTSAEEMMTQMQAQMQAQMAEMQRSLQVKNYLLQHLISFELTWNEKGNAMEEMSMAKCTHELATLIL